jgi:hypothetical protein
MLYSVNKIITPIAALLLIYSIAWADSEAPPYPYVTVSEYGGYYFKMIPDKQNQYDGDNGSGICFEVTTDQTDKILWTTTGWYAFVTYLSYDGAYLIRMGNWPRGQELSSEHLAVAFYKEGELLKSYSTKDLVKDPSSIERTVSHYSWSAESPKLDSYEHRFTIVTKDNNEYVFDITNGSIISQKKS